MASKIENTKTLFALAVASVIGTEIVLLFALQSGEKTRRDIRRLLYPI